jgi:hypothetical protein
MTVSRILTKCDCPTKPKADEIRVAAVFPSGRMPCRQRKSLEETDRSTGEAVQIKRETNRELA